jgi:hypothetical protein
MFQGKTTKLISFTNLNEGLHVRAVDLEGRGVILLVLVQHDGVGVVRFVRLEE